MVNVPTLMNPLQFPHGPLGVRELHFEKPSKDGRDFLVILENGKRDGKDSTARIEEAGLMNHYGSLNHNEHYLKIWVSIWPKYLY